MRVVIAFTVLCAPLALAQAPDEAALRAAGAQLEASYKAAQTQSSRNGDENMSCEQIQAELMTVIQSPGFQQVAGQQSTALAGLANGAVAPTAAAAGEEAAAAAGAGKKAGGGFFKKLGGLGQAAGAAAGAAGALGGTGRGLGGAAGAVSAANAVTAAGAAENAVAAANASGTTDLPPGVTAGAVDAAALQASGVAQGTIQVAHTAVSSPEFMRGARLVELGEKKGCNLGGPGAVPAGAAPAPQH